MSIYLGNKQISTPTIGSKEIKEIYYGNNLVYQSVVLPVKGDLITMVLGNTTPPSGTNNLYRVLKVNGTQVEVVAMYASSTSQNFSSSSNVYDGSSLDTYLNSTWYKTLNSIAKDAIVDKTFTQDSWYDSTSGNPIYIGTFNNESSGSGTYNISLGSSSYGASITRHIYALSMQDIIDYLDVTSSMTASNTTLTYTNIWKMFWNSTSRQSNGLWLRSARVTSSSYAYYVRGDNGSIVRLGIGNYYYARPSFTIDLSKIEWSYYEG